MLLQSAEEGIKILRVIDGDTVSAESRGAEIKIRLSEIDAPEMDQPFGTNSKILAFMSSELDILKRISDAFGT